MDVMLLWLIQSGAYMPAPDWAVGASGRGFYPARAQAMWNVIRFPQRTTHQQVLDLFFEAGAARYFAGAAPVAHSKRGRHAPMRFTNPPSAPSLGSTSPTLPRTTDTTDGDAAVHAAGDAAGPTDLDDCDNAANDAKDFDHAYHDDEDDPFLGAAFIDLYSAPSGRQWSDLSYEEAKALALRARTVHDVNPTRDPLPEPTEEQDIENLTTLWG